MSADLNFTLEQLLSDETLRQREFPVLKKSLFLAHAGVTILPRHVATAMQQHAEESCSRMQEYPEAWRAVTETRVLAARLIGARPSEIALLGPTSLGLSLVANGLDWQPGDEVICYPDDYPANVYPWRDLERRGVTVRLLQPESPGAITPDLIEPLLNSRTRLVALASCHFLSGFRIDVPAIGTLLRQRGILFCLDAIQTIGAFETLVQHVDFLSADSHKWMLGPMSAGIFYVKEELQEQLRPTLLGSWNVRSPQFIAQPQIDFEATARRYEPGALNINGILGMKAGIELILKMGLPAISAQLMATKTHLIRGLQSLGLEIYGPATGPHQSGITTIHPATDSPIQLEPLMEHLTQNNIHPSLRHDRHGRALMRFSPHFYNTIGDIDWLLQKISERIA